MINITDLKPIIEPLLNDENSADIISKIQEIDKDVSSEGTFTQDDIDSAVKKVNAEWNERFKKTFFSGSKDNKEITSKNNSGDSADDVVDTGTDEPTTPAKYEDLFTVKEEK